jgi:Zn-finger nucleic acid-binding protein
VCVDVDLVMSDRQGVEIDYCSRCRGVWLDRGELDKIVERSEQFDRSRDSHRESHGREYSRDYSHKPHKHKSFWREIFD